VRRFGSALASGYCRDRHRVEPSKPMLDIDQGTRAEFDGSEVAPGEPLIDGRSRHAADRAPTSDRAIFRPRSLVLAEARAVD